MLTERLTESLKNVLQKMEEEKTVENILKAKDVKVAYEQEREKIVEQIKDFTIEMVPFIKRGEAPFGKLPEFINGSNVVDLCFALLMTNAIDDDDLTTDHKKMKKLLLSVTGDYEEISMRLYKFLCEEGKVFSDYFLDEVLEKILL